MSNQSNRSLALSLGAFVIGMVLLAYAAVPLYRLYCQATGFGGVAERDAKIPHPVLAREVTVRFDANVNPMLPWTFTAPEPVRVKLGEEKQVDYIARNDSDIAITGRAVYNVTPVKAGGYFDKIQCFCFTEQTLQPHESKHFGVQFFVDPEMAHRHDLNDITTITLSYTFFPVSKK